MNFLWSMVRWVLGGFRLASADVIELRHETCRPCAAYLLSHNIDGSPNGSCGLCGCNVNLELTPLNKLAMPHEECPAQKWSKVN